MIIEVKESFSRKLIVSFIRIKFSGYKYKVIRKMPELKISETEFFKTKRKALKRFNKWLNL